MMENFQAFFPCFLSGMSSFLVIDEVSLLPLVDPVCVFKYF